MDNTRMKYMKLFVQLLEEYESMGINNAEFARKTGVGTSHISQIIGRKKWLSFKKMENLCKALDIPIEYFRLADENLSAKENIRLAKNMVEHRKKEIALISGEKEGPNK